MLEVLCDLVRGLAALWVFAYHIRPAGAGVWRIASVGDLGVSAFFVISGFCILSAAQNVRAKDQSAFAFLRRRLVRIYPPFWASVAVIAAVPFVIEIITRVQFHKWIAPHPLWYAYTWKDWLLVLSLGRVFFAHGQPLYTAFLSVNAVYWSLAIEVQFYLVMFAALVWRRRFNQILIATTVAGFAALAVPALRTSGLFIAWWPLFSVGMGLRCILARPVPRFWKTGLAGAIVLTGLIVASDIAAPQMLPDMIYPLFFAAGCGLVLWMAAPLDRHLRKPLRPFLWLGSVSYSLYLLHTLVSQVPTSVLQYLMTPDTVICKGLVMALTLVPVWIFYRFLELPFISTSRAARRDFRLPGEQSFS